MLSITFRITMLLLSVVSFVKAGNKTGLVSGKNLCSESQKCILQIYYLIDIYITISYIYKGKKYLFYAGCDGICPSNGRGIYCNDKNVETCRGCEFEQCEGYAKGNSSYGFSYFSNNQKSCKLCNKDQLSRLWGAPANKPYGVYIKSHDGTQI